MKSALFFVATVCMLGCYTSASAPIVQNQPRPQPPTFQVSSAAFSSDGKLLLTGYSVGAPEKGFKYKRLILWDTATGKQLWSTEGVHNLFPIAFLPDGKTVVVQSGFTGFQVLDVGKGTILRTFGDDPTESVHCAALSADGNLLLAGHQPKSDAKVTDHRGKMKVWEVETGKLICTIGELPLGIMSVALSPDNKFALSGHLRGGSGSDPSVVNLYEIATGRRLIALSGAELWGWPAKFSPDGKLAISLKSKRIQTNASKLTELKTYLVFWDVATGKEMRRLDDWSQDFAICPDGKHVLLARSQLDDTVTFALIDSTTGKKTWSSSLRGFARAVGFSPDGKLAFAGIGTSRYGGGGGGSIQLVLLDATNGNTLRLLKDEPIAIPE